MDNKLLEQVTMIRTSIIASIEPIIDQYILTKMKIHQLKEKDVKLPNELEHNLDILTAEMNEELNNISTLIK